MILNTGEVVFDVSDKVNQELRDRFFITSQVKITDNNWHHLVAVLDRDSNEGSRLYIDGVGDTGLTRTGDVLLIDNLYNDKQFIIGALGNFGKPFSGIIDEVKIFNEVLTPEEVAQLYQEVKLKGDIDNDDDVDVDDAWLVFRNWFSASPDPTEVDINQDGSINSLDFGWLVKNWGI